jgi:hypothetical protein
MGTEAIYLLHGKTALMALLAFKYKFRVDIF